ncbi:MAG: BglG family transcription antiterminator [Erysipelotrichaceae bacterium]
MRKNLINLLQLLLNNDSKILGKDLAKFFNVTVRTIQNYIKEINIIYPNLIEPSFRGYSITDKKIVLNIINKFNQTPQFPENNEARGKFIIKRILISKYKSIKVYDLITELYISISTFNNAINSARKQLIKYNLKINRNNNVINIEGKELDKRKLISDILYEESSKGISLGEEIYKYFPKEIVETAITIIEYLIVTQKYSINDYIKQNLTLHLSVLLFRVQAGNKSGLVPNYQLNSEDENLLYTILTIIRNKLMIEFEKTDQIELIFLIKTKINVKLVLNNDNILELIEKSTFLLVSKIVEEVNDKYSISLNNDSFKVPFSLHIQNLLFRLRNNEYLKNSSTNSIQKNYPLLFDISAHIAILINDESGFNLSDDEIAFIALHIGAELERQKTNTDKLKIIVVTKEYLDISNKLIQNIEEYFSNEIDIIAVYNDFNKLTDLNDVDLIISTIDSNDSTKLSSDIDTIIIPSFNISESRHLIYIAIQKIEQRKKLDILITYFDYFFKSSIFSVYNDIANKEIAIKTICDSLLYQGYVSPKFYEHILEREALASTAFGKVAIPHQIVDISLKSGVYVALSKNGITWNDTTVNIVLLISIAPEDRKLFKILYEALLTFFTDEDFIINLSKCDSFDNFKNQIFKQIINI